MICFSLCLTSLSMIVSKSIHVAANCIISFFLWLSDSPLYICAPSSPSIPLCSPILSPSLQPLPSSGFMFLNCSFYHVAPVMDSHWCLPVSCRIRYTLIILAIKGLQNLDTTKHFRGFPDDSDGKKSAYSAGDSGSICGLGRFPGERNGNPLQYFCLENPMDRGAWWAIVHGVTKETGRI